MKDRLNDIVDHLIAIDQDPLAPKDRGHVNAARKLAEELAMHSPKPRRRFDSDSIAVMRQPDPLPGGMDVTAMVQADLEERARYGEKKYGQRLLTNDGQVSPVAAYQEILDFVIYFRKAITERKII